MKFDLHIHSCLSPCASLEMSPSQIVEKALSAGMDGIALCDHQTAKNTPAIAECAARKGLKCLFGLEVQSAEEVHTLAIFDTVDQALTMTDWIYEAMPKRVNDPETFGDQPIVSWDDEIIDLEWRILAMGTRRSIPEIAEKVKQLNGLYIAAHIDRPNYSVISGLGAIPEGCFDAVELSRTADEAIWKARAADLALTRSSDAHNLDDVARVWTECDINDFTVTELKKAFERKATVISPKLTRF